MARQIKLSQIGDYASEQYEKLLRAAAWLSLDAKGWVITQNGPDPT